VCTLCTIFYNKYNNNSLFISTADNPQQIQQAATQDSTDTIEHKEPVIIEPNTTTQISMGGMAASSYKPAPRFTTIP